MQGASYRTSRSAGLASMTGLYLEWAELRAREMGQDTALAKPDMIAARDNILETTGGLSLRFKADEIERTYSGEVKACSSMARAADVVVVVQGG